MVDEKKVEMLRQIAEHYGISRNVDFAKFFNISEPTAFSRMKNGFIDFEEIYRMCPDISPDWLLSGGEGQMLRKDARQGTGKEQGNGGGFQNTETLDRALDALAREQQALAKAQEHISGLIDALRKA